MSSKITEEKASFKNQNSKEGFEKNVHACRVNFSEKYLPAISALACTSYRCFSQFTMANIVNVLAGPWLLGRELGVISPGKPGVPL